MIKKRLDKLDSVKEMLVNKLRGFNGKKEKTGKTLNAKVGKGGKKFVKGGFKKHNHKGNKGGKKKPSTDSLDKELDNYWIKKGDKGTV